MDICAINASDKSVLRLHWEIFLHNYPIFYLIMWPVYLHQQTSESITRYLVVICMNTMTTFWNMSRASAPIHITATRVK